MIYNKIFRYTIKIFIILFNDEFVNKVSNEFEVAESTVYRWANGIARPHPNIQRLIILFSKRYILNKIWGKNEKDSD